MSTDGTGASAGAERFALLDESTMSDAQREVYRKISAGPRGGVRGPFGVLLRSPELADRVQHLGAYARYDSALEPRLSELAILVTARYWGAQFEWYAHAPLAIKAGLSEQTTQAISRGERPAAMREDEAAVYEFCRELHERKCVGDASWQTALSCLGEQGVVDLVGICGYYTLISMVLNAGRVPLPDGVATQLHPLEQPSH